MFGFLKKILGKGEKKTAAPTPPASAPGRTAAPAATAAPLVPAAAPASGPVENVTLPLKPILDKLPAALRDKVAAPPAEGVTVALGIRSVAEQLQKGTVTVPFSELLQACPAGIFANAPARDATPVEIPLGALLSKLDPKLLTRRSNQQQVQVPDDVTGLFGADVRAAAGGKPVFAPAPAPAPAPKPPECATIQMSPALQTMAPPAAPKAPAPPPPPAPKPAIPPPPPAPPAVPSAPMAGEITVQLSEVSGGWPADVLKEIPDAGAGTLALPAGKVGEVLKSGKIAFPWKFLRTCLRPAPLNNPSAQDETVLGLPLSVIAPIFMAANKPAGPQKKVTIAENIPDMFSGKGPVAPPPPSPPAAPGRVAAPAPAAVPVAPAVPADIIQDAMKLPGVTGAVIALQEGLQVAAQLPPGLEAETVSAFLPQMFNRMSQYAKEMNLGELDGLTFTAGGTPWQIFKAGNLFLAVAGRKGESLPAAQLAAVAAELAQQVKK